MFVSFYSLDRLDNFASTGRASQSSRLSGASSTQSGHGPGGHTSRYMGDDLSVITEGSREYSTEGTSVMSTKTLSAIYAPPSVLPMQEDTHVTEDGSDGNRV